MDGEEIIKEQFERIGEILETDEYPGMLEKLGAIRACCDITNAVIHNDPEIRKAIIRNDIVHFIKWLASRTGRRR